MIETGSCLKELWPMQKNTDQSVGIYICIYRPTVYLQKTTTGITGLKIDIFVDHGGCTYLTVSCYLYIYIYIPHGGGQTPPDANGEEVGNSSMGGA